MTPCSRVIGHQGFGEKCAPSIFRVEVPSSLKIEAEIPRKLRKALESSVLKVQIVKKEHKHLH